MSQNDRTLNPRPPLTTDTRVSLHIGAEPDRMPVRLIPERIDSVPPSPPTPFMSRAASAVLAGISALGLLIGAAACTRSAGAPHPGAAASSPSGAAHGPDSLSAKLD